MKTPEIFGIYKIIDLPNRWRLWRIFGKTHALQTTENEREKKMNRRCYSCVLIMVMMLASLAGAQTVDDVINRAINAAGGKAAFDQIKSIKMQISGSMMGMTMDMTMQMVKPDKIRNEISVMGQQMIQATDGTDYWMKNAGQVMDMDPMNQQQLKNSMLQYTGDLSAMKNMGIGLSYAGMEDVDGVAAEALNMTMTEQGMEGKMYFDRSTGLFFKMMMMSPMGEVVVSIGDYREVSGVKFPHSIEMVMGGQPMGTLTIDDVQVNIPIDESVFKRPQ